MCFAREQALQVKSRLLLIHVQGEIQMVRADDNLNTLLA